MTIDDDPDDLATRLRAHSPAPLPTPWRAEILAAAGARATPPRLTRWGAAADALAAFLWPHPCAYAGLLAVWLLVLALRLSTPAPAPPGPPQNWATDAGGTNYQAVMMRELLAINAVFPDAPRPGEGRP